MADQARIRETRRTRRHAPVRLEGPGVTLVRGEELRAAAARQPALALRPGRVPDGVAVTSPAAVSAALRTSQLSAATRMTYPFSAMGRVMARRKSGGSFEGVCTGVLVGPNLVLTATHLLRDRPLSDWMFQFIPAYHGGAQPAAPDGTGPVSALFTGEVVHGNADGSVNGSGPTEIVNGFDFSIFRLASRLGDHWGHLGTITTNGSSFYEDRDWFSVGYPIVRDGGEFPIQSSIDVEDVEKDDYGSREIETESLITGVIGPGVDWAGWSGGPLVTAYNGAWWVGGVLSGWDLDGFDIVPFPPFTIPDLDGVHVFSGGPRLGVLMDIAYAEFDPPPAGAWTWLGGSFKSPPAVASWAPGRLDIVGISGDDAMYQKTWDGSRWLPSDDGWTWLGGSFAAVTPAAVSWAANRLDLFGVGGDGAVYQKTWDGSRWLPSDDGWTWLGGSFAKMTPAAVSWASNRLDVFGVGGDGAMYQKTWDGSRWLPSDDGWTWLGGNFKSPPAVASWAPGRLDVVGIGGDNAMYQKTWDGSRWLPSDDGWTWLGGNFKSPPAVASWAPGRLDVVGIGGDNAMYQKTWDGTQWLPSDDGWTWLGGSFATMTPAAMSWAANRLDLLGIGGDGAMYQKTWDGSRWLPS